MFAKNMRKIAIWGIAAGMLAGGVAFADNAAAPAAATPAPAAAATPTAAAPAADQVVVPENVAPPDVARGKSVFQSVGICVNCHGWDGDGLGKNPRSPGVAAKLRETQLDTETLRMTVRCGIPGSQMPYHDAQAYVDNRCYGMVMSDFAAGQQPNKGHTFREQDIENVVAYIEAKIKGKGPTTFQDCVDFWGSAVHACDELKGK